MTYVNSCRLHALKTQVARALESELTAIALGEQAVLRAGDREFHAVTAFDLEGGVIVGGAAVLVAAW